VKAFEKRLLVVGCARGGTRYLNGLMRAIKLDTRHEAMGRDGTVTSFFATDLKKQSGSHKGVRSDFVFEHIWHLVRHPLPWIRSAHAHLGWGYWKDKNPMMGFEVPCGKDRRCERAWPELGRFWIFWHGLIEEQEPELRIRLEYAEEFWPEMMRLLGKSDTFPPNVRPEGRDPKRLFKTPEVTWEMLGDAADEVRATATRYGYEVG
jgi:hypothetical protein